jgi:choline dehydrogenase-like flavoprotein
MALRVLSETDSPVTKLSCSVCVVGAGIAGLIAATRLAKEKQRRVVLVESGLKSLEASLSALDQIDNPSDNYVGPTKYRFRGLGGNSLLWAGKLLPLSPHDMQPRPYLDLEGWPFGSDELEPYRREIEAIMGVDTESHEESISARLDPHSLLARDDADFILRWPKIPTQKNHSLAYIFRKEIEELDNLEVWIGATVSGFDFDPASGKVTALAAINHGGKTLTVEASEYLIAAGTLESTRLLLLADQQANEAISRNCTALGRYFNDHVGLNVATLRPRKKTLANQALADRSTLNSLRHLHFELRAEVQEAAAIPSAYFDMGVELSDFSALKKAKQILQGLKRGKLDFNSSDVGAILQDFPSLIRTVEWQYLRKQKYWPGNANLQIKLWVEQLPQWQNRICLSEKRDALNLPMLKLEWEKTEMEEKTFRVLVEKARKYWDRHLSPICKLEWKPEVLSPQSRLVNLAEDLAHPAGSTRMGTDPAHSVVDPSLRVHRMPNLSVASASVFPSSGSANPTYTIMQLAMRAADAIAARLR